VTLTGLQPYTRYRYKVTCDGETKEGSFTTAAPKDQPFKFIAYGDTRTDPAAHSAVLARMKPFHPDFVLQSGDIVENGLNEDLWTIFFNTAADLMKDTPYYTVLGNHERNGAPYFKYFDAPRDYSFDYGNIHFVVLDSNTPLDEQPAEDEWLKKDLAAHQDATWRVVSFHHNVYTCVAMPARRVAAVALRARWEPIFLANHVQLVVTGHDHTYQHHEAKGVTYVVSGGGGAPLYRVSIDAETPFTKVAKSVHNDVEITVNGEKMHLRAVDPDGAVIDEFDLNSGK
jgi:3',5'-cyclic AMP phosphodiesterase CpdA